MTKDEALRLTLETLDAIHTQGDVACVVTPNGEIYIKPVITAIKAALEAKDEPVVWNEGVPAMLPKQKEGETFIVSYEPKLEAKDEPWSPVSIGVDVTKEGTHVIAMRLRPNGVNEVIYSQFHPLSRQEAKDEPVAWQYRDANDDGTWSAWTGCDKRLTESDWRKVRPLYTTPPQRKPLTDEEMQRIIHEHTKLNPNQRDDKQLIGYIINATRAIEAAHGIKGEA